MALDPQQKSVQSIADPTARKAAYYKLQRQTAEDGQDYKTLDKINSKLGKKTEKVSYNEPQEKAERDFGIASAFTPLGRAAKLAGGVAKMIPKATELAEGAGSALSGIASKAEGAISKAFGARQDLGVAKPVKKALDSRKALGSRAYEIKGGGTTKPSLMPSKAQKALPKAQGKAGYSGAELKPAGRAASSPAKRGTPNENRQSPITGKAVGKSPMRIQSDAVERRGRMAQNENIADMNKQAAKQTPKSMKPKKGEAGAAKLKARA